MATSRTMHRLASGCLGLALASGTGMAGAEEALTAYNTYQSVPFVTEKGGLAQDLVAYLNQKLKGKYQFQLNSLPRDRLNQTVINDPNFKGIVLLLNPLFVDDAERKKFLWTQPVMADSNAVISMASKKIEYTDPDSLKGTRFAGISGNRYAGLEDRFGKDIQRDNVGEEMTNIRKVAAGRADVTIMAFSTYRYLVKQIGESAKLDTTLYVSSKPHAKFDRFIFVSKADPVLAKELDGVIGGMKADPAWKAVLARYAIE
ncbi:transporter substrate-binding domain-containing protein [Oxalobacteraceae bacterium OM1]|nr:transporter substrate-binding domain-containing protein [Oxalobacteraceae bacterium OM1]